MKYLYLMVGPAGAGKSTFAKEFAAGWEAMGKKVKIISRDAIRFDMLQKCDGYFDKEDEVFARFISAIAESLNENEITFADATHLTERARNKVLDKLNLSNVDIIPVVVYPSLEKCVEYNARRTGRAHVPESVIARMYSQFEMPTMKEKYQYKEILKVADVDE